MRLVPLLLTLVCSPPAMALDLWLWGDDAAWVRQAQLPPGFELELLVDGLDGPRMLRFAGHGELLIGSKSGRVYRLTPPCREPEV